MKYWLKSNPEFVLISIVAIIIGIWIFTASGKTSESEGIQSDQERIDSERLSKDFNLERLQDRADSVREAAESKEKDWQKKLRENEKRNSKTIPRDAERVVDFNIDDQLLWWDNQRDSSEARR